MLLCKRLQVERKLDFCLVLNYLSDGLINCQCVSQLLPQYQQSPPLNMSVSNVGITKT